MKYSAIYILLASPLAAYAASFSSVANAVTNAVTTHANQLKCSTWRFTQNSIHIANRAAGRSRPVASPEEVEAACLRVDDRVRPQFNQPNVTNANSEEMIYRHAFYAAMTYCNSTYPASKLSNVHLGPNKRALLVGGFEVTSHYDQNNTSHYVAVNEHQRSIVLAFRGSAHMQNYLDSADNRRVKPESNYFGDTPKDAKVFSGYQRVAISQLAAAGDALENAYKKNPNHTIVIVGHSLGGALGHLAAVYMKQKRQIPVSFVYTYGEPIIGNVAFDDWTASVINAPFYRVVAANDIVPFIAHDEDRRLTPEKRAAHSSKFNEIYIPKPTEFGMVQCQGDLDPKCSSAQVCTNEGWETHSDYAGFRSTKQVCPLSLRNVLA
ncbi:Alpha/Beta hydrolase protein [Syncephalis fuscata]|nr:Alpha/Beta hydrolase protein [Syncephalis fuscata]